MNGTADKSQPPRADEQPRANRWDIAWLLAIVVAAFLLRGWALLHRALIGYDETYYYILARNLVAGHGYVLNGLPHATFPPLFPTLAGIASFVFSDPLAATSAVSAVCGALVVIPIYFLARDVHGRRAGLFAAVAAAALPSLFFYATRGVPYGYKMYAGTEPLYVTLLVAGAACLWMLARKGRYVHAVFAGVFFGLAALTRSEGPVVFALLLVWFVADRFAARRFFKAKTLAQAALVGAAMLVVFSPWLIHLRSVTGRWTLGPKLSNKVRIREALWNWFHDERDADFLAIHYRLNDDATWMEEPYWGVSDWHRERIAESSALSSGLDAVTGPDWRWAKAFAGFFYKEPFPLLTSLAMLLIAAGLLFPPWNGARVRWWVFLAFNFLVMLFLAVSVGALPRNELPLVALLCVSIGKGLDFSTALPKRLAEEAAGRLKILLIPAACVLVALMALRGVRENVKYTQRTASVGGITEQKRERELARQLSKVVPAGRPLMCSNPWIAVWAGLDWRVAPRASTDTLFVYARNRGVDYVLLDGWQVHWETDEASAPPHTTTELDVGRPYYLFDLSQDAEPSADGQRSS